MRTPSQNLLSQPSPGVPRPPPVLLMDARATQSATGGSEKQNCLAERKVWRSESRVRTAGGPDRISRPEYLFSHKNLKQLSPVDCLM